MDSRQRQQIEFPPKLKNLFRPHRYKVLYGGRGSAKSWSVARALLVLGSNKKLRILCTREIQKSIKDSVHKLLKDQIESIPHLAGFYDVLETTIRGKNGTEFLFAGLSNLTKDSIKSYEGVDIVWCEEAHSITKGSWDTLIPTIRKEGSEIWITFNPELDSDETYVRFVKNTPPDTFLVFINYHDNKWFPSVLEQERLHCQATQPEEEYNNIWEGHCRAAVAGAIYASEVAKAFADRRITFLPYDPSLKVHIIGDMGFADNMSLGMAQRARSELRFIDYLETNKNTATDNGSGFIPGTVDWCCAELKKRPYNWGFAFLPHDAFAEERKSGTSDAVIFKKHGFRVKRIPKSDEESRIKVARGVFPRVAIDQGNCAQLIECLKRYRRPDNDKGTDRSPVHDQFSHGADMFGYASQCIEDMINDEEIEAPRWSTFEPLSSSMGF